MMACLLQLFSTSMRSQFFGIVHLRPASSSRESHRSVVFIRVNTSTVTRAYHHSLTVRGVSCRWLLLSPPPESSIVSLDGLMPGARPQYFRFRVLKAPGIRSIKKLHKQYIQKSQLSQQLCYVLRVLVTTFAAYLILVYRLAVNLMCYGFSPIARVKVTAPRAGKWTTLMPG